MREVLVQIIENDVYTTTLTMAKGFGVEHRAILRLLKRYRSEFESVGVIATGLQKPTSQKGGRPTEDFSLNESQALYMGTLLTNTDKAREFKLKLTQEFIKQRTLLMKMLVQRQNSEWLQKRAEGKIERRHCTDVIQKFVIYATSQGSKNAKNYYMAISKMENQSLFYFDYLNLEIPNLRDIVNGFSLSSLQMADHIVGAAIEEGMKKELFYKEIYQLAKSRVEGFASLIGKTPLSKVMIGLPPPLILEKL